METMAPQHSYTTAAHSSHLPESPRAQKATRTVQAPDMHRHHHLHHLHHHHHHHHQPPPPPSNPLLDNPLPLSAPASQESITSLPSPRPALQCSESNLSSQSTSSTDLTSPGSSADPKPIDAPPTHYLPRESAQNGHGYRNKTPENAQQTPHLDGDGAWYSPMSIVSPGATNGAKRTASGHVKNSQSLTSTPYVPPPPPPASRRDSLSSAGSKVGELAATLKTRLGYAMAKVQNGWEHKSLDEVERLHAIKSRSKRNSISVPDPQRPGTSGLSNGASRLSMYDASYPRTSADATRPPPSKRHSRNHSYNIPSLNQLYTSSPSAPTPRLQPAPDIRPTSSHQRVAYSVPSYHQPPTLGSAMSPPRTPVERVQQQYRPTTIRTETQTAEAERDALQALFQLGSPHTSQPGNYARTANSSTQASPRRYDPLPRHVTFARSDSTSTTSSGLELIARVLPDGRVRTGERVED